MTSLKNNANDGYIVLITVLILSAVVSVIVGFLLITGQNATLASAGVTSNASAKAGATGCAELALAAIQANTSLTTPSTLTQTVNATTGETCTYTITGSSPNFSIASSGTLIQNHITYIHRMVVTTNQVTPSINVTSWQDSP